MTCSESYLFSGVLSLGLMIPIVIAMRTLLGMNERVIVPLLRLRTATGETQAITYRRAPSVHRPVSRLRAYVPTVEAKFTQSRRKA